MFEGRAPKSHVQNLAWTVLYVPYSLGSGRTSFAYPQIFVTALRGTSLIRKRPSLSPYRGTSFIRKRNPLGRTLQGYLTHKKMPLPLGNP